MSKVLRLTCEFENRIRLERTGLDVETQRELVRGVPYEGEDPGKLLNISILSTSRQGDCYEIGGLLFCSMRMKEVIASAANTHSQFFAVDTTIVPGIYDVDSWLSDYYLWNITRHVSTIDIIDRKKGKFRIVQGRKRKRVSEIKVLGLQENKIADGDLFRLWPHNGFIILGDAVAERLDESMLEGVQIMPPEKVGSAFDFDSM